MRRAAESMGSLTSPLRLQLRLQLRLRPRLRLRLSSSNRSTTAFEEGCLEGEDKEVASALAKGRKQVYYSFRGGLS
jgi:hypothetical protein